MKILGVSYLSDASATLLVNGRVIAAVSEERLNRVKNWNGFPVKAIHDVLSIGGISLSEIDFVATHGAAPKVRDRCVFDETIQRILQSKLDEGVKTRQIQSLEERLEHEKMVFAERTPSYLRQVESLKRPMEVYEHHLCHASSAIYGSGWLDAYVLTADGWGEDGSASLWKSTSGKLELVSKTESIDSLGYFYGSVTKALGFIPHRHEGKVLGLAAYEQNPKSYDRIAAMIDVDIERKRFIGRMENGLYLPRFENPELKAYVEQFTREDVAASVQKRLEEVVCDLVRSLEGNQIKLALAGGIFANVKLNQRLQALPNIGEVYVFPNMGDGGLSTGAAWLTYEKMTGKKPEIPQDVYWGGDLDEEELERGIKASRFSYEKIENIDERVGELLADGNIVARCSGRMEFGPRALGNRSILYHARDASVNKWLNSQLKRSEFMPFAPVTALKNATLCYNNMKGAERAAFYMTMTFDCTDKMQREAPAAIHVDGTARPQLVSNTSNASYYRILKSYHQRTGSCSLINTSYNMHEEPIVYGVGDSLRAFEDSNLPYLVMNKYLISNLSKVK